MAVTKADVFLAADEIAKSGDMPSITTVRKLLGDTGSESTLQKHLKDWKINLLKVYVSKQHVVACSMDRDLRAFIREKIVEMLGEKEVIH